MKRCIERALCGASLCATASQGEFSFRFAASEPVFAGHFPGHPILPGVYQVEMVRFAAEKTDDCTYRIEQVRRASFLRPILPEEEITVVVARGDDPELVVVRGHLDVGGEKAGNVQLRLRRDVPPSSVEDVHE